MSATSEYIEEELTIAEFAERFLGLNKYTPQGREVEEVLIDDLNIEILGKNLETGQDEYNIINKFIIKPISTTHYTDGKLKGTGKHRIIEGLKEISLENHPEFKEVNEPIYVVDFDINNTHNYYANGRLNHNTVSGGKAMAYHCSVRVRLNNMGKLKVSEQVVGTKCKAVVVKNRMGPPYRRADFSIYFDSGIADYASWLDLLKSEGIVKKEKLTYVYKTDAGVEEVLTTKDFSNIMKEKPQLREELYNKICDRLIMIYKDPNSIIREDVEVEFEDEDGVIKIEDTASSDE